MEEGFRIVPGLIEAQLCENLAGAIDGHQQAKDKRSPNLRSLLREVPEVSAFARSERLLNTVSSAAGRSAFPVRAILFDKVLGANWSLSWHQDLAIAVRERRDVLGFGGWSVKDGIPHVHPPAEILERMIAARIHLDDCPDENGALMVLPGSHKAGRLNEADIQHWKSACKPVVCATRRGDVLLMRPLLLHASRPATMPTRRRVLHIEHSTCFLPGGLRWHEEEAA